MTTMQLSVGVGMLYIRERRNWGVTTSNSWVWGEVKANKNAPTSLETESPASDHVYMTLEY